MTILIIIHIFLYFDVHGDTKHSIRNRKIDSSLLSIVFVTTETTQTDTDFFTSILYLLDLENSKRSNYFASTNDYQQQTLKNRQKQSETFLYHFYNYFSNINM